MSYFFPGLWHFAAAMAFAVGFGEICGRLSGGHAFSYRPEFLVACLLGSSALFFVPDAMAKRGVMKFLHYPLPDWDVLLLGPASHRNWLTHSAFLPLAIFVISILSTRNSSANFGFWHQMANNSACGLSVGLSSHLFWDAVSSRTSKIIFVPYCWSLRPSLSRVYLLGGAMISLFLAFVFNSPVAPKLKFPQFPRTISSTRNVTKNVASPLQFVTLQTPEHLLKAVKIADVNNPEGVSVSPDGHVFAVENRDGGNVMRIENGQAIAAFSMSSGAKSSVVEGHPNGSKFRGKTLFVTDSKRRQIRAFSPDKSSVVVVDAARGECINGPNDLAFAPNVSFYFTDPKWNGNGNVYHTRRTKNGVWKTTFFAGDFKFPNGVAVSPRGNALFVGEGQRNRIWKIEIRPDGSAGNKRVWCDLPRNEKTWTGPDGMVFDAHARLFVTLHGSGKIAVISLEGRVLELLDAGGAQPTNVAFSHDYRTLFISENSTNAIYKLEFPVSKSFQTS